MTDIYKRLTQVDAQLLNNYIAKNYGTRVGWIKIYGKKNCSAVAAWLDAEYGFTCTAEELASEI